MSLNKQTYTMKVLQGKINHCLLPIIIVVFLTFTSSCEKFVKVNALVDNLLAEQVFDDDATANVAITGIYRSYRNSLPNVITISNSLASGDVIPYFNSLNNEYYTNSILSTNTSLPWGNFYHIVYATNNAIERLSKSQGISFRTRNQLIAEAKFLRAFSYFYLVNLFGNVPLVMTTDVKINSEIPRSPTSQVYEQILSDLFEAQNELPNDYIYANGERIRANRWVATALLARVYLYLGDWTNAENQSTAVINSGIYNLLEEGEAIFSKNNKEAILQWANNATEANTVASNFIYAINPSVVCTDFLLNSFEDEDQRKNLWIQKREYQGEEVYIPFKFTTTAPASNEYFTIMRLAEQYLIRAEARAMQGKLDEAIADVNLIRLRHGGLTEGLSIPISEEECIDIILRERRVDLFTEGMHRWFDLKRTGRLDVVMQEEKPTTWKSTAALYPIPLSDIQRNPNLTQNPGYE